MQYEYSLIPEKLFNNDILIFSKLESNIFENITGEDILKELGYIDNEKPKIITTKPCYVHNEFITSTIDYFKLDIDINDEYIHEVLVDTVIYDYVRRNNYKLVGIEGITGNVTDYIYVRDDSYSKDILTYEELYYLVNEYIWLPSSFTISSKINKYLYNILDMDKYINTLSEIINRNDNIDYKKDLLKLYGIYDCDTFKSNDYNTSFVNYLKYKNLMLDISLEGTKKRVYDRIINLCKIK